LIEGCYYHAAYLNFAGCKKISIFNHKNLAIIGTLPIYHRTGEEVAEMILKAQLLTLICVLFIGGIKADGETLSSTINKVESYRAPWWGTKGAEMTRPDFESIHIDNEVLQIHYVNVAGRKLGENTLPGWHVSSFLAFLNKPAELDHQTFATFTIEGEQIKIPFIPHAGAEIASVGDSDIFKLDNYIKGWKVGQDKKIDNPLYMELLLIVKKKSNRIRLVSRFTNTGDNVLHKVSPAIIYEQQFNWSDFGMDNGDRYEKIHAPNEKIAKAVYAYSSGMKRGYEIVADSSNVIHFELFKEMNKWRATLKCDPFELVPGKSKEFEHVLRIIDHKPNSPAALATKSAARYTSLSYRHIQPAEIKTAPIKSDGRVMIADVLANLEKPKIRGLNVRGSFSQTLKDLDTLKEWGCNLVATGLGDPEDTKHIIEKGHALGMEMFLKGRGGYKQGPPSFEALYSQPVPAAQRPDAHGQDEDHYYWHSIKPTRNFENDFGKPMAQATQEEKVSYWGRCFHDKWQNVAMDIRPHAPESGIWFYTPAPGIANVDPLDYYDIFLKEITKLDDQLSVFPFYYGIEYNQAEYMVRRWKDAGAHRVAFLPMTCFMSKPSQFFRSITAARRGQADGACGFSFPVGAAKPEKEWEWKSVMLASWANFPTPELDAFCLMEEPAELVKVLAVSDVTIMTHGKAMDEFTHNLNELIPGKVQFNASLPNKNKRDQLLIEILPLDDLQKKEWLNQLPLCCHEPGKGFLQMSNGHVRLAGMDDQGLANAQKLLLRFAELAMAERGE
jgi:hypothetical protein